jgi:hypothetical protein
VYSYDVNLVIQALVLLGVVMLQITDSSKHTITNVDTAVDTLLALLRDTNNAGIVCYGAFAVGGLALSSDEISAMMNERAMVETLITAVERHKQDEYALASVAQALINMKLTKRDRKSVERLKKMCSDCNHSDPELLTLIDGLETKMTDIENDESS